MAWRKSWSKQNLAPDGTKRRLTPEQRSVWDDCLDFAEMNLHTGTLWVGPHVMVTAEQLAAIFKTPARVVKIALKRFMDLEMLTGDGVVINWPKYQSEYQRQKPYRVKSAGKVTT